MVGKTNIRKPNLGPQVLVDARKRLRVLATKALEAAMHRRQVEPLREAMAKAAAFLTMAKAMKAMKAMKVQKWPASKGAGRLRRFVRTPKEKADN